MIRKHFAEYAGCFCLNDPPKMVHRSTKLPEFEEFSMKYDEILLELAPKYRNTELSDNDALIQLGEAVWDRLYDLYGVKPTYERR